MVQTQFGSIGQLIKGRCLSDKIVMLLLSMLVLLIAIQGIFACQCEEIDWESVMSPEKNKTVIMAGVNSESKGASSSGSIFIHEMLLEKKFKDGRNNLTLVDSVREFLMFTPHNCNPSLLTYPVYVIYGDTDTGGVLHSNKCSIELFDSGFFNKSGRENLLSTLWGARANYTY